MCTLEDDFDFAVLRDDADKCVATIRAADGTKEARRVHIYAARWCAYTKGRLALEVFCFLATWDGNAADPAVVDAAREGSADWGLDPATPATLRARIAALRAEFAQALLTPGLRVAGGRDENPDVAERVRARCLRVLGDAAGTEAAREVHDYALRWCVALRTPTALGLLRHLRVIWT